MNVRGKVSFVRTEVQKGRLIVNKHFTPQERKTRSRVCAFCITLLLALLAVAAITSGCAHRLPKVGPGEVHPASAQRDGDSDVDTSTAPYYGDQEESKEPTSKPTAGSDSLHGDFDDNIGRTEVWSRANKGYMTYRVAGKGKPINSFTKAIITFGKMVAKWKATGYYGRPKLREIYRVRLLRYWNEMVEENSYDRPTEVQVKRLSSELGIHYKRPK